jgi:hypothetical protein
MCSYKYYVQRFVNVFININLFSIIRNHLETYYKIQQNKYPIPPYQIINDTLNNTDMTFSYHYSNGIWQCIMYIM